MDRILFGSRLSMSGRIQGAGGLLALLALLSLPGVAGGPGGKEPATPSELRLSQALLLPGDDRDDAVAEAIRSGLSPENGKRYRFVGFLETLPSRVLYPHLDLLIGADPGWSSLPALLDRVEFDCASAAVRNAVLRRALREGSARWGRERVVRRLDAIQSVCLEGIAELEDDLIQVFDQRDPEAPRWLNKSVQLEVLRLCTGMSSGFSNAAAELRRRGADVMVCMREDETFRRAVLLILDAADGSGEEDAATLRGAVSEVLGLERRSWRAKGMGTFNLDPAELAWREQMERRLREGPR